MQVLPLLPSKKLSSFSLLLKEKVPEGRMRQERGCLPAGQAGG